MPLECIELVFSLLGDMRRICLLAVFVLSAVSWLYADTQLAAVQEMLKARGFYSGEVNGKKNNETAAAITRFQVQSGLEVTGRLNEETVQSLGLEPSNDIDPTEDDHSRIEAWRALREQDREFLRQTAAGQEGSDEEGQTPQANSIEQIRDFIAGFVVAGISEDVEPELQFYAEQADYYDSGMVSKDFIRKDILRYNQKWPMRRYWLDGEIQVLNQLGEDPIEVRYQIKYVVQNQERESSGKAVKTLTLQKTRDGLAITSVREKTLN
jgi:Putative peptidoglycan binding domain